MIGVQEQHKGRKSYYPPSPERRERMRRKYLQRRQERKVHREFVEKCIEEGARVRELDK